VQHQEHQLTDQVPIKDGVAHLGQKYHIDDFVLIRRDQGPCAMGQVVDVVLSRFPTDDDPIIVKVRRLGRLNDIAGILPPDEFVHDVSGPPSLRVRAL